MNTGFARAVLEHGAPGAAFASAGEHAALYVLHDYGMSLLHAESPSDDVIIAAVARPRSERARMAAALV